ncbi:hypothetical protein BSKO_01094 [Bryopsis sp. KO-2023]|nr:hypothetical protein BSKO_01094 [Bryopsis sp. KO-2023]
MRRPVDKVAISLSLTDKEVEEDLKELGFSSEQIRAKMKSRKEPEPEEYEVEELIDVRERNGQSEREFLVSWVGWDKKYDQWTPESDLCADINTFKHSQKLKKKLKEEESKKASSQLTPPPNRTPRRGRRVSAAELAKSAPPVEVTPRKSERITGKRSAATTPAKRALPAEETPKRALRSGGQSAKKPEKKEESKAKTEPQKESDEEEYEVEKLLDVRNGKKGREFLISWVGYSRECDDWEAEESLMSDLEVYPMTAKVRDFLSAAGVAGPSSPARRRRRTQAQSDESKTETSDEDKEYEVVELVDVKTVSKKRFFQVRWKNYDELTWEAEDFLTCDFSDYNLSASVIAKLGTSAKRPKREHRT